VRVTCSRHGVDMIMVGAAELAGDTENAGAAALAQLGEPVRAITAREGRPLAVLLDDFDLSSAARLGSTEYTVNSQILTAALQHLADTGALKTAQGWPVPIVMTGNDYTAMRGSLLRPGRAVFFDHAVGFDEKCEIVERILPTSDPKSVRQLVRAYRKEPISFFAQLPSLALDEEVEALDAGAARAVVRAADRMQRQGLTPDIRYVFTDEVYADPERLAAARAELGLKPVADPKWRAGYQPKEVLRLRPGKDPGILLSLYQEFGE
jgi:hypothetical protein